VPAAVAEPELDGGASPRKYDRRPAEHSDADADAAAVAAVGACESRRAEAEDAKNHGCARSSSSKQH